VPRAESSFSPPNAHPEIVHRFHAFAVGTLLATLRLSMTTPATGPPDAEGDMQSPLTEYNPEQEVFKGEQLEWPGGKEPELPDVLGEIDEIELAAELIAVRDEQELDQFLGNFIKKVSGTIGSVVRSPVGRALGGVLKGVVKSALPLAGGALGTFVGGPLGTAIGSGLANMAGQALGLELEGLSREDQEFEATKRFIRFATEAVKNAASASATEDPAAVAQASVAAAARRFAPGFFRSFASSRGGRSRAWSDHRQHPFQPASMLHIQPAEDAMHDIDRTQLEAEGLEYEQQYEWPGESEAVFSEAEEMELASALMEVHDEQELDHFLGDLIRKAGRAVGSVVRSPIGQAIGGMLKGVAKRALPLAGGALGGFVGGPLGARIGSGLASAAGGALGLEAETWSQEDREFEGAKQFVRLAGDAVRNATAAGPGTEPRSAAQAAVTQAAQALLPGLQSAASTGMGRGAGLGVGGRSGRWMRRGSKIVLYGV
jgi:uncharacterized protein (DUF697 family)